MQVITDGLLTHYERAGNGRIVVILPGWADTSRSWSSIQKHLSDSYDVIVLDLPGFGRSQAPERPWDLNDFASFVSHFLLKIGAEDIYALIGHSNGGAIAIRGVSRGELTANKLVLVASAGIRAESSNRRSLLKVLSKTGKLFAKPLPESTQKKLRAKLYESAGSDMLVAEHMKDTFEKIVNDDVQSDAANIRIPTLLVYGSEDTSTPLKHAQTFKKLIANSSLETVDGAGHFLHVENQEQLVESLRGFMK